MTKFGPDPRSSPLTSRTWTYNSGPGPPISGPGPGHLGSGLVQTWVHQDQDWTLDSLQMMVYTVIWASFCVPGCHLGALTWLTHWCHLVGGGVYLIKGSY